MAGAGLSFGFLPSLYSWSIWAAVRLGRYWAGSATTDILKLATCAGPPAARAPQTVESYRKAPRATTCGHPKHHARGLCRSCYEVTPKVRARKAAYAAARYVPTPRKITARINSCGHPDRPHYAFGLCVACYRISPERRAVRRRYDNSPKGRKTRARYATTPKNRARQNAYAAARYVPRPPRPRAVNTRGHPDRKHRARGCCQFCYDATRNPRRRNVAPRTT